MKSVMMGAIAAGTAGLLGICELCRPSANAATLGAGVAVTTEQSVTDTVRLKVGGMTCGGCAISARMVLERLDGVVKAQVDYDHKLATVQYDAAKVTPEQMIVALKKKLKYTATIVKEEGR